ncbi:hypothetical protein B0H16DRAFT_1892972 [Mycena metata]|uniref:Uncharacterized protein n=1 Tax=Mycena metata TaxID=1033252 RepID=A0AAD7I107_9AGAR|nr:hypothetical protein B0H16DRAFT_1892972 [Mycena metata]
MSLKFVLAVNMVAVVLESLLYPLLLVSASTTLYLRFSRHEVPKMLVWNPVVLCTVFISATAGAHWILTLVRFFDAFLWSADPGLFYSETSQEAETAKGFFAIACVLMGDVAIVSQLSYNSSEHDELKIHRLWLIWNQSISVIIIPVLGSLGFLIVECTITYQTFKPVAPLLSFPAARWVTASWIMPLITNIYCTGLIGWKIWKTKRTVEHVLGDGILVPVLIVLLENAAVWTIWGLLFAIAYEVGSSLQTLVADLTPILLGLVNMAIYLRVELQCTRPQLHRTGVVMTSNASIIPYYVDRVSTQIPRSEA